MLDSANLAAILLTVKLASVVTVLLLLIGTPIAWWLANTRSWLKAPVEAIVALPIVLPPSVLGFYLLVAMGPQGPVGQFTQALGLGTLPFTFTGLVVASVFYSLPFVVQPIQNAFAAIGPGLLEAAATLRARPWDRFFTVALPLARPGFITAAILGFAHTVGEFGVVLMVGGNIPGETQTVAIAIYDRAQSFDHASAGAMSLLLLVISLVTIAVSYGLVERLMRRRRSA